MKPILLCLLFVLVGCGKPTVPASTAPQVAGVDVSHCPLGFPKAGLCASFTWNVGPTADKESSFTARFWDAKTGSPSGPYVDPQGTVSAFIQMQCCGSIFTPTLTRTADGVYDVTRVRFLPGEWKVFLQIETPEGSKESVHEDVDLTS